MRTLSQWFDEYAVSHQNSTNVKLHYVCVPVIFFSIVGLLMCVPVPEFFEQSLLLPEILHNWVWIPAIAIVLFYLKLSVRMAFWMLLWIVFCIFTNYALAQRVPILPFSITLFIVGWIGQFYGHKVEGQKPSFFQDLQFLLIGPAWVIHKLFIQKT